MTRVMRFIGVSTSGSSIMKVFPKWAQLLSLDATLVGLDLPIGATPEQYRNVIHEMSSTPKCVGALVTTHKIALFNAAYDLFSGLDEFAKACGEISSVKITNGTVYGSAKDPLTAGLALSEFLSTAHFKESGDVICFGDGGAATAIAWHLSGLEYPPKKIIFVGTSQSRLDHLRAAVKDRNWGSRITTRICTSSEVETIFSIASSGSLIINATGMGKDLPGSPIPDGLAFPKNSIVWELNYRGSLDFLHQAEKQAAQRNLDIHDGWRYFIHGWSQVVAEVFDLDLDKELLEKLSELAEAAR